MQVKELQQRFLLRLMTLATLTACFFLLAMASLAARNLGEILSLWGEEVQISAYLSTSLTPSEVEALRQKVLNENGVAKVELITQEEALEDFRVQMASYAPDLVSQPDLFSLIPPSLQVTLHSDRTDSKSVAALAKKMQSFAGIEEVRYGQEWIEKYGAFLGLLKRGASALGLILMVATLLMIGNTTRASIEARRAEVEVMELIGATPWMIRKPFFVEGILLGLGAAVLAMAGSAFAFLSLNRFFANELRFLQLSQHLRFLPPWFVVLFFLVGAALGGLAAYLCVRRLNNGFAAAGASEE